MLEKEFVKKVRSAANNYRSEVIAFCQDLIRTKSVNGIDDERKIALLVKIRAEKLGLPSELIFDDPARPNIFVGRGFNKKDGLLFVAHLDTVSGGGSKKLDSPTLYRRNRKRKIIWKRRNRL